MTQKKQYDVVIIGGGPAGLTAAIYAARANLSTVFIEKGAPGGKMVKTFKIENWSGDEFVDGATLSLRMFNHARKFAQYAYGNVVDIQSSGVLDHDVILEDGKIFNAKCVIIATGTVERIPETVKNIHRFENFGVSYCAICDGPLYKGGITAIIGGGNSAAEEAMYLSSVAKEVHIFVRKPKMRAVQALIDDLSSKSNVFIHYNSVVQELFGDQTLKSLNYEQEGMQKELNVDALFPYIGLDPQTGFANKLGITNDEGYIITNDLMETKAPGIFAVGDVREKHIRQIVTATADGAIAGKIVANKISQLS